MGTFFQELFQGSEDYKIKIDFEDIIPGDIAAEDVKEKAVYIFYIQGIAGQGIDADLRLYRKKSLKGELLPGDYEAMERILKNVGKKNDKIEIHYDGENRKFSEYARVKSCAMSIAQILFVNNSYNEGLLEFIDGESMPDVLKRLSEYIKECAQKNGSPLTGDEIEFYATLFIFQTAFDRIFVPHDQVVQYREKAGEYTGEYDVTNLYKDATRYLTLTNKKVISAPEAEKELCYTITTGWSKGIDLGTWNELNRCYYGAKSPTTGKRNLFTENYDKMLERMLPQFALSRAKLAGEVLKNEFGRTGLRIVEIGAGSGAFAIDLVMACKRLGIKTSEIKYTGLEPSEYMRKQLDENIGTKIGDSPLPPGWELKPGDMESVTANPSGYLGDMKTVIVLCYSAHHCFEGSLKAFFESSDIHGGVERIYVLDVVKEHGWTKPYYMWADCESFENFDNVVTRGMWRSETLWLEPSVPIEGYALTNAWCSLRKLTARK